MLQARPYHAPVLAGALAVAGLAGCAMDDEAQVRAELGRWVEPGATLYFESRLACTAARFEVRSSELHPSVEVVRHLEDGLRLVAAGRSVAFHLDGKSPTAISEEVMSADLPGGIGLLSAGVGGKDCMDEAEQIRFFAALHDPSVVMVYAPATNALALLDPNQREVFFVRGDV